MGGTNLFNSPLSAHRVRVTSALPDWIHLARMLTGPLGEVLTIVEAWVQKVWCSSDFSQNEQDSKGKTSSHLELSDLDRWGCNPDLSKSL